MKKAAAVAAMAYHADKLVLLSAARHQRKRHGYQNGIISINSGINISISAWQRIAINKAARRKCWQQYRHQQ